MNAAEQPSRSQKKFERLPSERRFLDACCRFDVVTFLRNVLVDGGKQRLALMTSLEQGDDSVATPSIPGAGTVAGAPPVGRTGS